MIVGIALAIAVRLFVAALWPPNTDELLYWRYSAHLAPGFIDHPALNPLMIRLGRGLFGDTPLGIRFFAVLSAVPASWAVWRASAILFDSRRSGATAALLFNLTVAMSVGSIIATSDAMVVLTSALLLFALAKLARTQDGAWWLVVGLLIGVGMSAKYTTLFLAFGVALWTALSSDQRKWLRSPWPYLGAAASIAVFSPVLLWNADHQWASATYQASRMAVHSWSLRYVLELVASQIGLVTPPVFVLACIGAGFGRRRLPARTWMLLLCQIVPVLAYFLWHALHERVQGNWPECVYPAVACFAAYAAESSSEYRGALEKWARGAHRAAVPFAVAFAAFVYVQGAFGVLALGRHDPTSRLLTWGWPAVAAEIDATRARIGAPVILADDYSLASTLPFYLPTPTPVQQISERIRWINEPQPDAALFTGPMLYVCRNACGRTALLPPRFRQIRFVGSVERRRNGVVVETFSLYRLAEPIGSPLDDIYPVRAPGVNYDTL